LKHINAYAHTTKDGLLPVTALNGSIVCTDY